MRPGDAPAPYIGPLATVEPRSITVVSATPDLYTNGSWPFRAHPSNNIAAAASSELVIVDAQTTDVASVLDSLGDSQAIVVIDGGAALAADDLHGLAHDLLTSDLRYVWASSACYGQAAVTISSAIASDTVGAPVFCRTSIVRNNSIETPVGAVVELVSSWMGSTPDRLHVTATNGDEYQSIMLHFPGGTNAVCDFAVAPCTPSDEVYFQGTTGALGWPAPGVTAKCDLIAITPGERRAAMQPFLQALRVQLANGMPPGRASLDTAAAIAQAISQSRTTGATAAIGASEAGPS